MHIRFEAQPAFTVRGYAAETELNSAKNDPRGLFDFYRQRLAPMEKGRGMFGVMWYADRNRYHYLLGLRMEEGEKQPPGARAVEIPASHYAVATVLEATPAMEAWADLFKRKLPALGCAPDAEHGMYLEYYPPDGGLELWAPVRLPE